MQNACDIMTCSGNYEATLCPFSFMVLTDAVWVFKFMILILMFPDTAIDYWCIDLPLQCYLTAQTTFFEIVFKCRHHWYQPACPGTKLLIYEAWQIIKVCHGIHRSLACNTENCDLFDDYMLKSSWSTWPMCIQESSKPA